MTTFEEAVAFLNERDIHFIQEYEYVGKHGEGAGRKMRKLHVIKGITPPFSSDEWLDLISADSELLQSCCAVISNARDVIYAKVRQDRFMSGSELWEFFGRLAQHDGFDYMFPPDSDAYRAWDKNHGFDSEDKDPIYRLWKIFDKIKNHLAVKSPETKPYPEDAEIRKPLQAAFRLASAGIDDLSWATGCFARTRDDDPQWLLEQRRAQRQLTIARVAPSLRTILDHLHTIELGDFEGFAVCKREEPDEVCANGAGRCIYATEEHAKEMIERWSKSRDEKSAEEIPPHWVCPRETTVIRPVRVSHETGLTFLDV